MQMINTNLKDNYPYGDYPREEKPPWAVNIWLENLNGLRVSHRMDTFCIIVESTKDVQANILALPRSIHRGLKI
eukprot:6662361-Ditylum_brightwellii.AAC.1